jgi:hypothetical protein
MVQPRYVESNGKVRIKWKKPNYYPSLLWREEASKKFYNDSQCPG